MTGSVMSAETPIVFVVDDDRSVRDSLRRLIASVGMTVEVFPTAQAFLSTPRRDAPGCLVLDVRLPGLSGLDLQRKLVKTDATLPIIILTGHGDIPMSVRAMKAGAIEFLPSRFADRTFSTPFDTRSIAIAPLERSGTSWLSFVAGTTP
jgi:FixJ family two-component response regulator